MPLGDIINSAQLEKGMGLRALARELGIAASYLSDIENDRRVPSEAVLRDMARLLELDFDLLMQQAGLARMPSATSGGIVWLGNCFEG